MAYADLKCLLSWPCTLLDPSISQAISNTLLIDAASEKAGHVFKAPKTGNITKLYFATGTVTTGATVDVRLETVDGSGLPSGTLKGTTTNYSLVIANSDDNKWLSGTMTLAAAVTQGDDLAVVVANPAVSFGNLSIGSFAPAMAQRLPYALLFTSSWAKQFLQMSAGVEYDDGSKYNIGFAPWVTGGNQSFNDSTNPDERGLRFQLPVSVKIGGVWASISASAGSTFTVKLYDVADTLLESWVCDGDETQGGGFGPLVLPVRSLRELTANTTYRLTIRATNATNVVQYSFLDVVANADLVFSEGGIEVYESTRNNDGAWTDTTTRRPHLGVLISQVSDGASSAIKDQSHMTGGLL